MSDEDVAELRAKIRLNEKRFEALLELLAREGIVSREEFRLEFESSGEEGE